MDNEKDNIEKLILDNLDGLNEQEPKDGHFGRFEQKLKQQNRKDKVNLRIVWRVAAAVIFVFLAVNQTVIYFSPDQQETITALGEISPEYNEVEFYYTSSIDAGLNQWQQFDEVGLLTDEDKLMMENELAEFDEVLTDLQEDLKANPNDERVINAMLDYYQNKLNIINLIIDKLQEVKIQKETNHEIEI
ncbi:MAG: hypothetical protein HQ541_23360 [Mariniphaga sp.]|nr:hypothetical protein [Mariniphaga sp.]